MNPGLFKQSDSSGPAVPRQPSPEEAMQNKAQFASWHCQLLSNMVCASKFTPSNLGFFTCEMG